MSRNANKSWNNGDDFGSPDPNISQEQASRAVLQDIRDELQALRRLAECPNVRRGFIAMHRLANHIGKHGAKPKPTRKQKS